MTAQVTDLLANQYQIPRRAFIAGIRDNNDLIWVGRASNVAAKLAAIREAPYYSFMTDSVNDVMHDSGKIGGHPPQHMWEARGFKPSPDVTTVYRSSWTWVPGQ